MQGHVTGSHGVELATHAAATGGYMLRQTGWDCTAPNRAVPHGQAAVDAGRQVRWDSDPSSALASVASFTPEGNSAATAYERYQKDAEGGWIWGNSITLDTTTNAALKEAVRVRKHSAFAYSMEELPGYSGDQGPFSLDLDTDKPVVQPPRRYSPKEKEVIAAKTAELMKPGIVKEYVGPTMCAVNPVLAAKKDPQTGMWTDHRMAQDYRPVNQHTLSDRYGLHRPEEIFQRVGKAVIFSKLDLRQGFLQIPIKPEDQPKTAYWVGNKLMMYTRMPYGLKNASAKFQRVMDYELAKAGLDDISVAFIDDVLIWSETPEQHVRDVERVLDALSACGLRAHPDKSIFGADVIEYLGHNLSPFGISPHQAKVAAIMALQPPKNVSELRTQLGFVNYYRCYVPNMSQTVVELNKLLKKDVPWSWGPAQQEAHDAIKAAFLREGMVLRRIDYSRPLILHTDFSNRGIGAVLGQLDDEGNEYMCACISRSLNKHEAQYSSYKGEMLAAVWAVKMFRHHLIGGPPFKLVTDHQPLTYLMSAEGLTGQYARFALVLQEYNFTIEHRPGIRHQNADTLSRNPRACSADNTGARLDEDLEHAAELGPAPREALATVRAAWADNQLASASVHLTAAVAPFSEDFCPSPEEAILGWNGWRFEERAPPPEPTNPVKVRERRQLHSAAQEWFSTAKRLGGLRDHCEGDTRLHNVGSPFFQYAMQRGITLYEPLGGACTGLESCLRNGIRVNRYLYSDTSPEARGVAAVRLAALTAAHPELLPPEAWRDAFSSLPADVKEVTREQL
ncbi:hypothetical protein Vretimale_493, partial [Volvox reticuliferus]